MKIFMRALAAVVIVGIGTFSLANYLNPPVPLPGRQLRVLQFTDILYFAGVALFIIALYLFWFSVFRHWKQTQFASGLRRKLWFWIILIGGFAMFLGPIAYYIMVIELGKVGCVRDGC